MKKHISMILVFMLLFTSISSVGFADEGVLMQQNYEEAQDISEPIISEEEGDSPSLFASSSGSSGGSSSSSGVVTVSGEIGLPRGYNFTGYEEIEFEIATPDAMSYEFYDTVKLSEDGSYSIEVPSDIVGEYIVSIYPRGFENIVRMWYSTEDIITFTGENIKNVDFTLDEGYIISGQIDLSDADIENAEGYFMAMAYAYDGEFPDLNVVGGEGDFCYETEFSGESAVDYQIRVPKSVGEVFLAYRISLYPNGEGEFKSNVIDDHFYYTGDDSSSLECEEAKVISVDGDIDNINVPVQTGISFFVSASMPQGVTSYESLYLYIKDKNTNETIKTLQESISGNYGISRNLVFPKEYKDKELYFSYKIRYQDNVLYDGEVYVNPDNTLTTDINDAKTFKLGEDNSVDFKLGLKNDLSEGIKGKISFDENSYCNGYGTLRCKVYAYNIESRQTYEVWAGNMSSLTEIKDYSYSIPVPELSGKYIIYAELNVFFDDTNISEDIYYYNSEGMVFSKEEAEQIDISVTNKNIDFKFGVLKKLSGKLIPDGEYIYATPLKDITLYLFDEEDKQQFIGEATLDENLNYSIDLPTYINGTYKVEVHVPYGSNIVSDRYQVDNVKIDSTDKTDVDINVVCGYAIKGKVKLNDNIKLTSNSSLFYYVCVVEETSKSLDYVYSRDQISLDMENKEATFVLCVPKQTGVKYKVGLSNGDDLRSDTTAYTGNTYYVSDTVSCEHIDDATALDINSDIELSINVLEGITTFIEITKPDSLSSVWGYCYIEDVEGNILENIYFNMYNPTYNANNVFSKSMENKEVYLCFSNGRYSNTRIYVNPDGALTNNKNNAKTHTVTSGYTFKFTLPEDDSLYKFPSISGTVNFPDDGYATEGEESVYVTTTLSLLNGEETVASKSVRVKKDEPASFEFDMSGYGSYILAYRVRSYSTTNITTDTFFYYTGDGWSLNKEDSKLVSNANPQSFDIILKTTPVIRGVVKMPESARLDGEITFRATITSKDGAYSKRYSSYITEAKDIKFDIKGTLGVEEYILSYEFRRYDYSTDTNIDCDSVYYYKDGEITTSEEEATIVTKDDNIEITPILSPEIKGTVLLPEDAVIPEDAQCYMTLMDEQGYKISSKEYPLSAEGVEFCLTGRNDVEKYSIEIIITTPDGSETNLEKGPLYYTKERVVTSYNERKYYTYEELKDNVEATLPKVRTISGKLIADDYKSYGEFKEVSFYISNGSYGTSLTVPVDENLNYSFVVPGNVVGKSTLSVQVSSEIKNNIVKNKQFDYKNPNGTQGYLYLDAGKSLENVNIEVETGYIVSGKVKLPEFVEFQQDKELTGIVDVNGSTNWRVSFTDDKREDEFFLVTEKTNTQGIPLRLYFNSSDEVVSNLYFDSVHYVDNESMTPYEEKQNELRVVKDVNDIVLNAQRGVTYTFSFQTPQGVTLNESMNIYCLYEDGSTESHYIYYSQYNNGRTLTLPYEEEGHNFYLYYDLSNNKSDGLYREKVYINDDSLVGAKDIAQLYTPTTDKSFNITFAKEDEISFPEYIYKTKYPYINYSDEENTFSYTYSGAEDIDYLKVTFSEECYMAYGDNATIYYGDEQKLGSYTYANLADKTLYIPGKTFKVVIEGRKTTTGFGYAIEKIEGAKFSYETAHPYVDTEYVYTHPDNVGGLRISFSKDTAFNGSATITYTNEYGIEKKLYKRSSELANNTITIVGDEFRITLPENNGSYYGFSITDIEPYDMHKVTFKNYDGTDIVTYYVEAGKDVTYLEETPERQRDENYIYVFKGWDKTYTNVRTDLVVTALYYSEPYYTVDFKATEDGEVLYTDYVIKGRPACYIGDAPAKASTETKAYVFAGWNIELDKISGNTTAIAVFEEKDILFQSNHTYADKETYTYEYLGEADSIQIVFSSDSYVDEGDCLIVKSEKETGIDYELSGKLGVITVAGKKATFEFEKNSDNDASGYAVIDVIPKWHSFSRWIYDYWASCTEQGVEYRYCYNCSEYETRNVAPKGHCYGNWQEEVDGYGNPTGVVYRVCSRCYKEEIFDGDFSETSIVNFNVVDATSLEPIEYATITICDEFNNEMTVTTDERGNTGITLTRGVKNLTVYKNNYMIRNISVDVNDNIVDVPKIGLSKKPMLDCILEAEIMDKEQIEALGIDTSDPANNHIYKYSIGFGFGSEEKKTIYYNKKGEIVSGGNVITGKTNDGQEYNAYAIKEGYFLVVYGQAKWLKEMFDVELIAFNTSNTDTIENLVAELYVPDGMTLVELNGMEQEDVAILGSLDSGEKKSYHWYLRGDKAGNYNIGAKLTGKLMPFGEEFGYNYSIKEPIKVYAGNALEMNIIAPRVAVYGEDYEIKIEIENVSDRSIYNLSNQIDKVLQGNMSKVGKDGEEIYFEENALGYIAVEELKPGEKIVAKVKANILFESQTVKNEISKLAGALKDETDVLALYNSYKDTLDLFNDNYDIIKNALENLERSTEFLTNDQKEVVPELTNLLNEAEYLVRVGVSGRAMTFINGIKADECIDELTKLSKDANYYVSWGPQRLADLYLAVKKYYDYAIDETKNLDYDIYRDIKQIIEAVPVSYYLKNVCVTTLSGSTTQIPKKITYISDEKGYTKVTNVSNYYYNLFTRAIDKLTEPWYIETPGVLKDREGVLEVDKIIKGDIEKTMSFAVTDVSGDTRFNAWVEGENGAKFSLSSTAEGVETTESGITFTGPCYLNVTPETIGKGTLYVQEVSQVATFSTDSKLYTFKLESSETHNCYSDEWVEMITPYDGKNGYKAKYCSVCEKMLEMKTVETDSTCKNGSYEIKNELFSENEFSCSISFDSEIAPRSALAVLVLKDEKGVTTYMGLDSIKIKPNSTVDVEIPLNGKNYTTYRVLIFDTLSKLRPVGNKR